MISLLLAAALLTGAPQTQDPVRADDPVSLEDITVTGRPLDQIISDFVSDVAEPNRGRGLARWEDGVCVGVAHLRPATAQYLVDRISTVAEDLGLRPGAPGCAPNILVVATDDGAALARSLVERRRRAFRMGGAGMDRGGNALQDFVETDRPVRWWQMALPVDSETGQRAVRFPGDCEGTGCLGGERLRGALAFAPKTNVFAASRLRTQVVDSLTRAVVIVDVDDVSDLSLVQLADYVAMVSLAQINPDADTRAYASILNVFADPQSAPGLTDWDQAYLNGLYDAQRNSRSRRANRQEIIDSIRDAHRELQEARPEEAPEGGGGLGR